MTLLPQIDMEKAKAQLEEFKAKYTYEDG